MNKTAILTAVMFAEVLIIPACFVFSILTGYQFIVNNYPVFLLIMSAIFIGTGLAAIFSKQTDIGAAPLIFTAHLLPLVEICYFFCMFDSLKTVMCIAVFGIWAVFAIWVTAVVYKKSARLWGLKAISFVISALMLVPLMYFSFIIFIFGDLGENTVVVEATSPEGTYTVQVIDSDQGALGGDTLVYVYSNKRRIDLGFIEFGRDPECIYRGAWGEYKSMNAHWVSDNELALFDRVHTVN